VLEELVEGLAGQQIVVEIDSELGNVKGSFLRNVNNSYFRICIVFRFIVSQDFY